MGIAVSGKANSSKEQQLVDSILVPSRKWFTLSNNALDGTYHPTQKSLPQNLLDYSTWVIGTSGAQPGFAIIDAAADSIVSGTDPYGNTAALWHMQNPDVTSDADGGWNTSSFAIDNTKTYRFCVWVKRINLAAAGRFYLGLNGYGVTAGVYTLAGTLTTNPYFWYSGSGAGTGEGLIENEWVLVVGHVRPYTHTDTTLHPDSGIFNSHGVKIGDITYDFKWHVDTTSARHRTYLYYATDLTVEQFVCYPRVDICDGTEPALSELFSYEVDNTQEQVGFYSSSISDGSGVFASPPQITWTLDDARSIHNFRVVGDSLLNVYPVHFRIRAYQGANLLYEKEELSNNSVVWTHSLPNVLTPDTIEYMFYSINRTNSALRLLEISNSYDLGRSDSILVSFTESSINGIQISKTDVLTVSMSEVKSLQNVIASVDNVLVTLTDTALFTLYEIWKQDSILTSIVESGAITAQLSTSDALSVSISNAISIAASISKSDSILLTISNSGAVNASVSTVDSLLAKVTDISTPVVNTLNSVDNLLTTLANNASVTNNLDRTDTLNITIANSINVQVLLVTSDSLLVKSTDETGSVIISIHSIDSLITKMLEQLEVVNVHTMMDTDLRQVFGKVEVTYSDPFSDESITISANSTAYNTNTAELADGITETEYKWFSLHENVLNGTYHAMPDLTDPKHSVGWWSNSLSNANGTFTVPPVITVLFNERSLYSLKVVGDDKLNCYPTSFVVVAYDQSNNVLHTETVTNNASVVWEKAIDTLLGVCKLTLTINAINKGNSTAKITEFYTAVVITYEGDDLTFIHLYEELDFPNGTVPIGNISANELEVSFNNINKQFSLGNTQSPIQYYLKKNRRIKAWLGVEVLPDEIEWHPLGTFWTTKWNVPKDTITASAVARDRLELLRFTDFDESLVYQNYSVYSLFDMILTHAGLTASDYSIDTTLQSITIPYAWFTRCSHRDALQKLSSMALIQVYCNRDGKIIIANNLQPTANTIYVLDDDKNIFSKEYPLAWGEITNYVEVVAKPLALDTAQEVYKDEVVISVTAGTTIQKVYEFTQCPVMNVQAPVITGGANISVQSYTAYAWGIVANIRNSAGTAQNLTSVSITGQPLTVAGTSVLTAKDDTLIREEGRQKITLEADFIQNASYAQTLADTILAQYKSSKLNVYVEGRGDIALRLGDRVEVYDRERETHYEYMTSRQVLEWDGSLSANIDGNKI